MNKKAITAIAGCGLGALCIAIGACAATAVQQINAELRPDFTIVVDGQTRTFKNVNGDTVEPILYNGTTYLPVRAIGELMGKTVYWYEGEKKIELKDESSTVTDADAIVPSGGGGAAQANTKITADDARAIALEKAGLADAGEIVFDRNELDRDNGRLVYEIEFRTKNADGSLGTEYSAEIDADTGEILSWEVDKEHGKTTSGGSGAAPSGTKITADEARSIALQKAGFADAGEVVFEKNELDRDDGKLIYEIEFHAKNADGTLGTEYSAEIDANTGEIISWETEKPDRH